MDEFSVGLFAGVVLSFIVASIVFLAKRWRDGNSLDAMAPEHSDTEHDPDLGRAMIEHALTEAAAHVVDHGLVLAERAAELPTSAVWQMRTGDHAMFVSPGLFTSMERLALAVRAQRGEKLSDLELGVLHGVLAPMRFRTDVLPVMLFDDAS